jgi:dipeptidyl aminopeptidase/acylaminoacyl peptidase
MGRYMKTERIALYSDGIKLAAALDYPEDREKFKFIVGCHGLFSTKESDKWRMLGKNLTAAGYGFLRIDFRGCGESEGDLQETTISGRMRDLAAAIEYVKNHPCYNPPIGLVGSSLGGMMVLVEASNNSEIGALAAMAAPASISPTPEIEASLREKGYFQYPEARLNKDFWEDGGGYRLTEMVPLISCPALLIHGDKDEQVPLKNASTLYNSLQGIKKLKVLAGGDHRFSDLSDREKVIKLVVDWFLKYLTP